MQFNHAEKYDGLKLNKSNVYYEPKIENCLFVFTFYAELVALFADIGCLKPSLTMEDIYIRFFTNHASQICLGVLCHQFHWCSYGVNFVSTYSKSRSAPQLCPLSADMWNMHF